MANIIMITTCYPSINYADTEICHYFTKEWVKMGHKVKVFVLKSKFPEIYYSLAEHFPFLTKKVTKGSDIQERTSKVEMYKLDGVDVCSIPMKKYIPHWKFSQRELRKTVQLININCDKSSFIPDAIVGHWCNPTLHIIAKLKEKYPKARTSITLHGETYTTIKKNFPDCNSFLSQVDMIGFRSPSIMRSFYDTCPIKLNGFYCYSGVSDIFFDDKTLRVDKFSDEAISKFVYVGRFMAYKYPRAVIEALLNVYDKPAFHLLFVGRKTDLYNELIEYVQNTNLSEQVQFLGLIPREKIPSIFDDAQCLIMISKGEVFGMVYLEAMARGCIIVAGADSGVQEIIKHGENGFLCEPGNVNELSQIINHINNLSAIQKKTISENARKTASELSDTNVAKTYLESVINRGN